MIKFFRKLWVPQYEKLAQRRRERRAKRDYVKYVEILGLALVLSGITVHFLNSYTLMPYSDPGKWYVFGKEFFSEFGVRQLAYGFPLVMALAIKVVGPYIAFLVNIPILLLLLLSVYQFARQHAECDEDSKVKGNAGLLCGAFALLFFIILNKKLLLILVNPYRDPMAFVWSLLGCMLIVRMSLKTKYSMLQGALAGVFMGIACSTRETSVLLLIPLFLFSVSQKLKRRNLMFWRPLGLFLLLFVMTCSPFLYQNVKASGNALVPVQGAEQLAEHNAYSGSDSDAVEKVEALMPGINRSNWAKTFPQTIGYCRSHYGFIFGSLFVLGLVIAVVKRNYVLLLISFPSSLLYFMFYANYSKVVDRYLFVIDLFAVPVMAYAASVVLSAFIQKAKSDKYLSKAPTVCVAVIFCSAAVFAVRGTRDEADRLMLHHAANIHDALAPILSNDNFVIAERPTEGIIRCFTEAAAMPLTYLGSVKSLRDPLIIEEIDRLLNAGKVLHYSCYTDEYERFITSRYDYRPVAKLRSSEFGLRMKLFGEDRLHLGIISQWSATSSLATVISDSSGWKILTINSGALSRRDRNVAKLYFGETLIDEAPTDYSNYYPVYFSEPGERVVKLESDAAVPSKIIAELQDLAEPLRFDFAEYKMIEQAPRLSPEFHTTTKMKYPFITQRGSVLLPVIRPDGCVFSVSCRVSLESKGSRRLTLRAGNTLLYDGSLSAGWHNYSGIVRGENISDSRMDLSFEIDGDPSSMPPMLLKSVNIRRSELKNQSEWQAGKGDSDAEIGGAYGLERLPDQQEAAWHWIGEKAQLRFFMQDDATPISFKVGYFDENRPDGVSEPKTVFMVNGTECEAEYSQSTLFGMKYIEAGFTAAAVSGTDVVLGIEASSWVPAENGLGNDRRKLGVMLHSVSAERQM